MDVLPQCFFTDHLKHKTVNETTCIILSTNTRHLQARQLEIKCDDHFTVLS